MLFSLFNLYKFRIIGWFLFVLSMMVVGCTAPVEEETNLTYEGKKYRLGFYNVENLFDTLDYPGTADEDYTPESNKQWGTKKYHDKINKLSRVIVKMGSPAILGMAEVENKTVLNDLLAHPELKGLGYEYVHFNSPDYRGIDVALLYQPFFKVFLTRAFEVDLEKRNYTTREILLVGGQIQSPEGMAADSLFLLVNHWPSRAGGVEETEPRRIQAANKAANIVDSLFLEVPNANVVVMGDFNDEPHNKSVKQNLGTAHIVENLDRRELYNPMAALAKTGKGSYMYDDTWDMLDQLMVSPALIDDSGELYYLEKSASVFKKDWLLQQEGDYAGYPDRTYAGDTYLGGYSDHLPVYIDVVLKTPVANN